MAAGDNRKKRSRDRDRDDGGKRRKEDDREKKRDRDRDRERKRDDRDRDRDRDRGKAGKWVKEEPKKESDERRKEERRAEDEDEKRDSEKSNNLSRENGSEQKKNDAEAEVIRKREERRARFLNAQGNVGQLQKPAEASIETAPAKKKIVDNDDLEGDSDDDKPTAAASRPNGQDESDTLEQFMLDLSMPAEKRKRAKKKKKMTISLEELETQNSKDENTEPAPTEEEDDAFYQQFVDEMKKKQEEADAAREKAEVDRKCEEEKAKLKAAQPIQEERLESDAEESEEEPSNGKKVERKPEDEMDYFELAKIYSAKKELPIVDHSKIEYAEFTKNLYVQSKEITQMKDHEVDESRKANGNIRVRGKRCPRPIKNFSQCGLPDSLMKILDKREYETPFPIQMQCLPALMCGRDVIGVAQTGSGKTIAYLMPMLRHCLDQPPIKAGQDGPIGLVISPTRELGLQISRECNKFCRGANLRCVASIGGMPLGEQISALKRGCEIVVGTPGRLIDVLTVSNGKVTNLRRVTFLVLDEADRMFDMGFEPQINMFVTRTRPDKQTCMFSATFPPHIEGLARKCLNKPLEITIGTCGSAATSVKQFVEVMDEAQKFYRLLQLLGEWNDHGSIIIFVRKQKDADTLFMELLKYGYGSLVVHGGMDQTDRDTTIQDFKDGGGNILVATSVVARGLDVKKCILVINFMVPDHLEDYIHRIGRTGRAGSLGFAYTFLTETDGEHAEGLIGILRQSGLPVSEKLTNLQEKYATLVNMGQAIKKKKHGGAYRGRSYKYDESEKSRQQQERTDKKKELKIGQDSVREKREFMEEIKDPFYDPQPVVAPEPTVTSGVKIISATAATNAAQAAMQLAIISEEKEKQSKDKGPEGQADAPGIPKSPVPKAQAKNGAKNGGASSSTCPSPPKSDLPDGMTEEDLMREAGEKAAEALKKIPEAQHEKMRPLLVQRFRKEIIKNGTTGKPPPKAPPPKVTGSAYPANAYGLPQRDLPKPSASGPLPLPNGCFQEALEINDYPEIVRKQMCHRELVHGLEEKTGCQLQVKGIYSKGAPPLGYRKLYIEIIHVSSMGCAAAKRNIRRELEEMAKRTLNIPGIGNPRNYNPITGANR